MKRTGYLKVSCGILAFCAMSLIYYFISRNLEINSDMASGIIEAVDVSHGNIFLKGWYLSTVPFYFTEIIWYAIVIKVFGFHHEISYAVSAVYLSTLIVMMALASDNKKYGILISLFMVGSPTIFLAQNILSPVIHIGTYIFSLVAFIYFKRYAISGDVKKLAAPLVILPLLFFSDGMSILLVMIPAVATAMICLLGAKIDRKWISVAIVCFVSYAASIAIKKLFMSYGFVLPGIQETRLADTDVLIKNISDFFEGTVRLYDGYFFGLSPKNIVAIEAILSFSCVIFFFIALASRFLFLKEFKGHDIYLLVATLIMPLAFIFSNISAGLPSIRYIIPFFVFGSVYLSGKGILDTSNRRIQIVIALLLVTSGLTHIKKSIESKVPSEVYVKISKELEHVGLKKGFASYWDSSSVSIYGKSLVAPVYAEGDSIIKSKWLSNDEWYKDKGNFVIVSDESFRKACISSFGTPDRIIKIDSKDIYIWSAGISAKE